MNDYEQNPNTQTDTIDGIIAIAKALPDFPNKALVIQRLETRNLNRYSEATQTLNEVIMMEERPIPANDGCEGVTKAQLQSLIDRIARLEASDIIAE